jgi:uncharacterized repeat protein (TIGR01451 family)
MASATFALEQYTGDNTRVLVTMTEMGDGSIEVALDVSTADGNLPGDIQGVFFHLADEGLLGALQIIGDEIGTVVQGPANGVESVPSNESFPNDAGAVMSPEAFDLGIGIGPQGGAVPVSRTIFTIKSASKKLSLADFAGQEMGVRMQSVIGGSEGSSKLSGEVVVDPPPLSYAMSLDKSFFQITHAGDSALPEWTDPRPSDKYDWAGEKITYRFALTNEGEVGADLADITINDSLISSDKISQVLVGSVNAGDDGNGIFESGETWLWEGVYQVVQSDIDDGSVLNTAFALANGNGTPVQSEKDEVMVKADQRPSLLVTKTADRAVVGELDEIISYTIDVENTGNVTLSGLVVNDPLLKSSVYYSAGNTDGDSSFDVDERWVCKGAYQVSLEDFDNKGAVDGSSDGWIDNTASAEASFGSDAVTGQASASVQLVNPFEGLSQGYWRNHSWDGVDFSETGSFDQYFLNESPAPGSIERVTWNSKANPLYGNDITFYQALTANGGGKWALAREAVAGVLNAAKFGDEYRFAANDIREWVGAALTGGTVDIYNDGTPNWASGQATVDGLQRLLNQYNGNY